MSCLPGGLDRVSKGFGVRRHAVAACIVGLVVLLTGCLHEPKVVQVECRNIQREYIEELGYMAQSYLWFYWSDGDITNKFQRAYCPESFNARPAQTP